eukprot:02027.XXX_987_1259_1 [CDS] Oithona nana genome sequencing.
MRFFRRDASLKKRLFWLLFSQLERVGSLMVRITSEFLQRLIFAGEVVTGNYTYVIVVVFLIYEMVARTSSFLLLNTFCHFTKPAEEALQS